MQRCTTDKDLIFILQLAELGLQRAVLSSQHLDAILQCAHMSLLRITGPRALIPKQWQDKNSPSIGTTEAALAVEAVLVMEAVLVVEAMLTVVEQKQCWQRKQCWEQKQC